MMTSSTSAGSILVRSTRALRVSARRSSGRTGESFPLRLPTAVRTAPTITALFMTISFFRGCQRSRLTALDLIVQLAEGADLARGHLAAHRALLKRHGLGAVERPLGLLQKAEEEVVLGPRRLLFQPVEDLLVGDGGGALGERTFVDDVVDAPQKGVGRRLALGQPIERLHAPGQLGMRGGERGRLARERIGLPVEHVAEEHRRLVVQVVAGGDDRVAVLDGGPIHEVALAEPAGRAGGPARGLLDLGDGRAHGVRHALHDELLAAGGREGLALALGLDGVVEDAQIEIEPRRLVARLDQHVPQREGILAAGDGDQDLLLAAEHPVLADRLRDLLAKELLEVRRAEGGVVPRQLEDGLTSALAALHWILLALALALPPDMTGRTSSTSSSPTTSSAVRRSLPRITSTVLGRMSSSRSTSLTRLRPDSSTSRLGLRSLIFTVEL